ncbi:hypothetical protein DEO72_LG2g2264 [Vigna unguiculata]|uniref:Uncharacterized protein n=1 Tax=Vigna unguiculata TaxID=3917 RepID=A0A4D6KYP2_VIGUN|nr:hypothetical protein DEO72_LG2g2264 [Vigna unguiculata]
MGQITKPGMNRLAALGCRQATHQRRGYSGGVLKKMRCGSAWRCGVYRLAVEGKPVAVVTVSARRLATRWSPPGGDGELRVLSGPYRLARENQWQWSLLALGAWRQGGLRQAVTENYGSCLGRIAWRWGCDRRAVSSQTKFASLCLGLMAKSNRGTVMFPSATIGRGVHSMVIACAPGSKLCKLGCVTTGEESVGLDYEQDWLVGLDHERDSFVEAQ